MAVTKLPNDTNTITNSEDPSQRHINYLAHEHQVSLINNIFNGVDTSTQYLTKFPQELLATYTARQENATLRNFVKRAVQAFTGMIFRKPMEINGYGKKTAKLFPKIDTNQTIENFTKDVATALTKDGKTYVLADSPMAGEDGQPYLMLITREAVINWRKDKNGKFTMVVIEEIVAEEAGTFGTEYIKQWRHYDENGDITIWRLATKNDTTKLNTSGYVIQEKIITGFTSIPIQELVVDETPMLYDIGKMNIKHLNRQSHKDRYLTMAALPIPVIWGAELDGDGKPTSAKPALVIGVDEAFIFTGTKQECDFEWRELSGDSIDQLEKDLNSIVEDITTGILRAAETANAVQKTATEVQLLQAEASNRVTAIANAVEVGMRGALEILSEINKEKVPETAKFIINKDFNASLMGSDGARVVMESYLTGMLSMETFLNTMSDMELISIDSAEKEIKRIKADTFKPTSKTPVVEGTEDSSVSNQTDNRSVSVTDSFKEE